MSTEVVYIVEIDKHPDNDTHSEIRGAYSTLDKAKMAAGRVDVDWLATHNAGDGWVEWYKGGHWWAEVNNGQNADITRCEIDPMS